MEEEFVKEENFVFDGEVEYQRFKDFGAKKR
jgi:hypothetical protein